MGILAAAQTKRGYEACGGATITQAGRLVTTIAAAIPAAAAAAATLMPLPTRANTTTTTVFTSTKEGLAALGDGPKFGSKVAESRKSAAVAWLKAFAFQHELSVAADAAAKSKIRTSGYNYPQVPTLVYKVPRPFTIHHHSHPYAPPAPCPHSTNAGTGVGTEETYDDIKVAADRLTASRASLKQFRRRGHDFFSA